jgi:hypothetical protein
MASGAQSREGTAGATAGAVAARCEAALGITATAAYVKRGVS